MSEVTKQFEEMLESTRASLRERLNGMTSEQAEAHVQMSLFHLAASDGMALIHMVLEDERDFAVKVLTGQQEIESGTDVDSALRNQRQTCVVIDRICDTLFRWPTLLEKAANLREGQKPPKEFHPGIPDSYIAAEEVAADV